jgi:LemA protein
VLKQISAKKEGKMKTVKSIAVLFLSILVSASWAISAENKKARELGEKELGKYVIKCGDSWYVKRAASGPFELKRNGITILKEKTLSESDKLNGIEYWGVLEFSYYGPQREYGYISETAKGWSKWEEVNINIDIWIQNKGSWKVELSNDIFRGSLNIQVTCADVPGYKKTDIKKLDNDKIKILENKIMTIWEQVDAVYQKRADLVPKLIEAVKEMEKNEKEITSGLINAKNKVDQNKIDARKTSDHDAFKKFQLAQDELGSAISRLLVAVEKYSNIKALQNFRNLQIQLEGVENRILVERQRYNEAVQEFNAYRMNSISGKALSERPFFRLYRDSNQR